MEVRAMSKSIISGESSERERVDYVNYDKPSVTPEKKVKLG
jgi:hypothetical protein